MRVSIDLSVPAPTSSAAVPPTPTPPGSMLIDARRFAEGLDVNKATLDRMKAVGKLPRHIELSRGCHLCQLSEVRARIEAGCPTIDEWKARHQEVADA